MTPPQLAGLPVLSQLTIDAIQAEATRAHLRHGDHSMLGPAHSHGDRLTILTEELMYQAIGSRLPAGPPLTPAQAARMCSCGYCWAEPGQPCTPAGDHLARYAVTCGALFKKGGVIIRCELFAGHGSGHTGRCPACQQPVVWNDTSEAVTGEPQLPAGLPVLRPTRRRRARPPRLPAMRRGEGGDAVSVHFPGLPPRRRRGAQPARPQTPGNRELLALRHRNCSRRLRLRGLLGRRRRHPAGRRLPLPHLRPLVGMDVTQHHQDRVWGPAVSHINASISITPDPESIRHHIYDDGAAFIDLTASFSPTASVQLWVGRQGADLPADAAALRKLAAAATEVAAHLERRRVQLEREKEAQQ